MRDEDLRRIARFARGARYALIGLTLAAYGFAYYLWTAGQSMAGLVVALFGYTVLRSRVNLCYGLTVRYYRRRSGLQRLLAELDANSVAQGESAMRERLQATQKENLDNE